MEECCDFLVLCDGTIVGFDCLGCFFEDELDPFGLQVHFDIIRHFKESCGASADDDEFGVALQDVFQVAQGERVAFPVKPLSHASINDLDIVIKVLSVDLEKTEFEFFDHVYYIGNATYIVLQGWNQTI